MGKFAKIVLVANLCFWVYFWVAFFLAAQPYDPRPWGHVPVDPYSFGGHAIGLTRSSLTYPFMQAAFWIEFPSFLLATLGQRAFFSSVSGDQFFAGISVGGYKLLVVMVLSFLQWYFMGWLGRKLWERWSRHHPSGALKHSPSS
jgi:hypothetical protein